MKKLGAIIISLTFIVGIPAMAEKYAGEFMYLGVGARPLAMGNAYLAADGDIFSTYYNPAGLTGITGSQATFMHSETFGSLLNHDYIAYAKSRFGGVAAVSMYRLGGGGILVTEEYNGIFRVKSEKSHADYVFSIAYGRKQSPKLDWGATAKIIYRKIVDDDAQGIGLDAGVRYRIRDNLTAAAVAQDLTGTILSYSTSTKEVVNPTLKLGLGYSYPMGNFKAALLTDADLKFEGRQQSAQFSQSWISGDTHLGAEISYKDVAAVRVGSDIGNLTTGVGIKFSRFHLDLALLDNSDLDTSYRGSLVMSW
jgi:hypothetical protein